MVRFAPVGRRWRAAGQSLILHYAGRDADAFAGGLGDRGGTRVRLQTSWETGDDIGISMYPERSHRGLGKILDARARGFQLPEQRGRPAPP